MVLDTTYLLPSLGISVKEIGEEDIRGIMKHGSEAEYLYPSPLLAELLAKVAKEASKRGITGLPAEACDGLRALLAGLTVTVETPTIDSLILAAELWIRGHRDIMDNVAYAHALKTKAYFMTLDETLKKFLAEKGYPTSIIINHKELRNVFSRKERESGPP